MTSLATVPRGIDFEAVARKASGGCTCGDVRYTSAVRRMGLTGAVGLA